MTPPCGVPAVRGTPDDAEIEAILAQWRRHREMALALARKDRAARAEQIRADLAARRAAAAGPADGAPTHVANPARTHRWLMLAILVLTALVATVAA